MYPLHVIFASYGNDSMALIQWAADAKLDQVYVVCSDTGWAAEFWKERTERAEAYVRSLGFIPVSLPSEGLADLVRRKKGWPRQGIQFCTLDLKILPALAWLEENDPFGIAICFNGVRREESSNRADTPECVFPSHNHGKRMLRSPLAMMKEAERDELIRRTGFDILPHRSMECFPCINSNRADLRMLAEDESRIAYIEGLEAEMGMTSKGKPRTMFRPYRYMGATGIREIVRWAQSAPGKFDIDDGTGGGCDSGYCGT